MLRACGAEVVGTYLLVVFGTGAVAAAVLTGAQSGIWQVAVVWGFGITIAIYVTAAVSGAHLNPAVSLTFAIFRRREFPYTHLLPYWTSQLTGAVLAALTVLWLYGPFIARFESEMGLVRGAPGSQHSAMVFGEYFPNPALFGTGPDAQSLISPLGAAWSKASARPSCYWLSSRWWTAGTPAYRPNTSVPSSSGSPWRS